MQFTNCVILVSSLLPRKIFWLSVCIKQIDLQNWKQKTHINMLNVFMLLKTRGLFRTLSGDFQLLTVFSKKSIS